MRDQRFPNISSWRKLSKILTTSMEIADEKGAHVAVVVLDYSGNEKASISHLQAAPMATEIARAKAFTSLNFGLATSEAVEKISSGIQNRLAMTDRRLLFLGGGIPIFSENGVEGAIGVSGSTPEEDSYIAKSALAALDDDRVQDAYSRETDT